MRVEGFGAEGAFGDEGFIDVDAEDAGGYFFALIEEVVRSEGEVGGAAAAVEEGERAVGRDGQIGEGVVEKFEELVDLGVFGPHGGTDVIVAIKDAEGGEEGVGLAVGEGEIFGAVVGDGSGWSGWVIGEWAGVNFFSSELEFVFFREAGVDFFGGGANVDVGKADGEEIVEGEVGIGEGEIFGDVLLVGEVGEGKVRGVVQDEGADGDTRVGGFLQALGAGEGGAKEMGGEENWHERGKIS